MTNKLLFDLELLPHPYAGDPSTRLEAWGRLVAYVITPNETIKLSEQEWNLDELAEWFIEHRTDLCNEGFPGFKNTSPPAADESLAQAIERSYATGESLEGDALEQWMDNVREPLRLYSERHSLSRALPGAGVPPIIIGCNREFGEISLYNQKDGSDTKPHLPGYYGEWSYSIDMEVFLRDLRQALQHFLADWSARSTDPAVHARANNLIAQLRDELADCCQKSRRVK